MFGTRPSQQSDSLCGPEADTNSCLEDIFSIASEYGIHTESFYQIHRILEMLLDRGYYKAEITTYSVYDRVIGGIAWIFQQLVPREQAQNMRIQWDILFRPREALKDRLAIAQEIHSVLEKLCELHTVSIAKGIIACPEPIQPHQLLLQDFGDITSVVKTISWLLDQLDMYRKAHAGTRHLAALSTRRYCAVRHNGHDLCKESVHAVMLQCEPQRKWRYRGVEEHEKWKLEANELAQIQSCLFEYGDRIKFATNRVHDEEIASANTEDTTITMLSRLALEASQKAIKVIDAPKRSSLSLFEKKYEQAEEKALAEQKTLQDTQLRLERELLDRAVKLDIERTDSAGRMACEKPNLQKYSTTDRLAVYISQRSRRETLAAELERHGVAFERLQMELEDLQIAVYISIEKNPLVSELVSHLAQNDTAKQEKSKHLAKHRQELKTLQNEISALKSEQRLKAQDAKILELQRGNERLRLRYQNLEQEISKQAMTTHKILQTADQYPSPMESLQYEKRILELQDEVALRLEETRKYFAIYNNKKLKLDIVTKELSLMNSILEQVDSASSCRANLDSFQQQLCSIVINLNDAVAKQSAQEQEHQAQWETLDAKYQELLNKERLYLVAIAAFQKECEKHDALIGAKTISVTHQS